VSEIEFQGHTISGTQIKTDPNKIAAGKDWPILTSLKELQCKEMLFSLFLI